MTYTCKTSKKLQRGFLYIDSIIPDKNNIRHEEQLFCAHFTDNLQLLEFWGLLQVTLLSYRRSVCFPALSNFKTSFGVINLLRLSYF